MTYASTHESGEVLATLPVFGASPASDSAIFARLRKIAATTQKRIGYLANVELDDLASDAYELFISEKVHASFSVDRFSKNAPGLDRDDAFFAYFAICFANYARDIYHARYMTVSCPRNSANDAGHVKLAKSATLSAAYTQSQAVDITECHALSSQDDSTIGIDDLIALRNFTLKNCPVLFQRMFCVTTTAPDNSRKRVTDVARELGLIAETFSDTINDEAFAEVVSDILKDVKNWRSERRGRYRKRKGCDDKVA